MAATASASQLTPTPAAPDSASVTYSYATPSGTAQLYATGQYDATNGYSGTISNNAGVVIAVTYPIHGTLTGAGWSAKKGPPSPGYLVGRVWTSRLISGYNTHHEER